MLYTALKHLHVTFVALSGLGFALRGVWMMRDSPLLRARLTRMLPHVIDSGLLASAIALAAIAGQVPFVHGWLTAKVLGLVAYIGLGMLALKAGRPKRVRIAAFAFALATFAWIVSVALTKDPAGYFALL